MHNTTVTEGDSPWNRRHGEGNFAKQWIPFGCTVDFMPKAEVVAAKPKFEPRGYYLQPWGRWKGEYLIFDRECFVDYDFGKPRKLMDLIRSREVKMTDKSPHSS